MACGRLKNLVREHKKTAVTMIIGLIAGPIAGVMLNAIIITVIFIELSLSDITSIQHSLAQTNLAQKYSNAKCGITIMYPSNWIIEELNEKFGEGTSAPMTGLANFNPDTPESYKSTIESEAWDISKYPDKSIEGIAESEKDYVHLSPDASIEEAKRIESISGLPHSNIYHISSLEPYIVH
jgi:hypothetical protein